MTKCLFGMLCDLFSLSQILYILYTCKCIFVCVCVYVCVYEYNKKLICVQRKLRFVGLSVVQPGKKRRKSADTNFVIMVITAIVFAYER